MIEDNFIDFSMGVVVGMFGWFFGGLDGFLKVLLTFSIIDYLSGVAVAIWVKHNLSSAVGFKGISKKCLMFSFVGIAHILDKYLLGGSQALRTAVLLFYIGNEGLSVIENADALGVPFPQALKDKFLNFKNTKKKDPAKEHNKNKGRIKLGGKIHDKEQGHENDNESGQDVGETTE